MTLEVLSYGETNPCQHKMMNPEYYWEHFMPIFKQFVRICTSIAHVQRV